MSVKIMAAMPKGEHNGLAGMEDFFDLHSGELVPLVALVEVAELGEIVASGEVTVKLRMAEVEVAEREGAQALIRASRKERTGHDELDLDGLTEQGEDE